MVDGETRADKRERYSPAEDSSSPSSCHVSAQPSSKNVSSQCKVQESLWSTRGHREHVFYVVLFSCDLRHPHLCQLHPCRIVECGVV